jgi:cysteine desulfurase
MIEYLEKGFGNPISQHRVGDEASGALESARAEVAALINASPQEVVFTSGGTESINHAIKGVAFAMAEKGKHIVTSNIEHQAVLRSLRSLKKQGYHLTSVPVDEYGLVDPKAVEQAMTGETILVSIQHANNEVGTIEPIAEIGKITRKRGIFFHTDAVASTGVVCDGRGSDLRASNQLAARRVWEPCIFARRPRSFLSWMGGSKKTTSGQEPRTCLGS